MSAINAVTLKPTQSALWLRPPVPPERRNAFYRGFNAVYGRMEHHYAGLIGRMASHAGLMTIVAFVIIGLAFFGLSRVPTGFLPIEDQGYLLVAVQLPDGAALERTQKVLEQVSTIAQKDPSVAQRDRHLRRLSARQQRDLGQCRRRLCGAEGLERARRSEARCSRGCRRRSPRSMRG